MHITALVQRELSQKDGDALVAEAKAAVAAEEQNLEPDLALLTTADFEVLAPTATQRGEESVRAVQASLLADTGCPNLTDQQMQHMILDGIADMQLAEHLAIQSHKIRMRGYHKIAAATAGGPQEGFTQFMGEMFCGSIKSSSARSTTQGGGDAETQPPSRAPSPSVRSTTSADQEEYCPLDQCKIVYPISADTLSMSGVPSEMVSPRRADGYYGCMYGGCGMKMSGKPAAAAHVRRQHLGIAIGCRHCSKRYYKSGGWGDHMKNKHPEVPRAQWFADPEAGDPSSVVTEPDPHAAAAQVAKALAEKIYPEATALKRPLKEEDTASAEKTYPEAEAPTHPPEEDEGSATTDSDVVIVEAKTTAPMPKKRRE